MPVYQVKGKYLLVRIVEPYSLKLVLATIGEAAARCRQEQLDRLLADLREMVGVPTIMDRYEMGVEIARVFGSKIQCAAVADPGLINWLAESVAVNRGANFKVFSDMAEAMKWLEIG